MWQARLVHQKYSIANSCALGASPPASSIGMITPAAFAFMGVRDLRFVAQKAKL